MKTNTATHPDDTDLEQVHEAMRRRLLDSRARLQLELAEGAAERQRDSAYPLHTGDVPDTGDSSVATEQADLRNAQIGRDVGELRQVEAALGRMAEGSYGFCIDCGQEIPPARLNANPAAERCILCQTARERQYADTGPAPVTRRV